MVPILAETTNSLVQLARAERESDRQLRAALLRVGSYVGLDEPTVIRFSETVTGCPWARCRGAEVVQIGKCLLDIVAAVRRECGERRVADPSMTLQKEMAVPFAADEAPVAAGGSKRRLILGGAGEIVE